MKKYLIELLWIIFSVGVAILIYSAITYSVNKNIEAEIELPVRDVLILSYTATETILNFAVITGFLIFAIRIIRNRFACKYSNIIFIIYNVLSILLVSYLYSLNEKYSVEGGWTIYPPLSALPQKMEVEKYNFITESGYIILVQILLILIFGYTTYRMGKNKKTS
ncbi:hypothetical protein [Flavobacterium alkalisoli]|uniref:hypothetical protein n=1 Tax=Flavobacterium alkalisoli TaxID=2602769 RepID=UPI003A91FD26